MKNIRCTCSSCGNHVNAGSLHDIVYLFNDGYRTIGSAFYCKDCVKEQDARNGKPFDEYYKNPHYMWMDWWDKQI